MTTGRINQVTTFRNHFRGHRLLAACQGHPPLSRCGVRQLLFHSRPTAACGTPSPPRGVQATSNPQMASPCFPFSHVLSKIPLSHRETKVTALYEDYQRPATPERHTQTWRIPQWLAASGLTIGKQSTSFNIARSHHIRMARGFKGEQSLSTNKLHNHQARPLRISSPAKRDSLTRRKTSQPTIRKRPNGE